MPYTAPVASTEAFQEVWPSYDRLALETDLKHCCYHMSEVILGRRMEKNGVEDAGRTLSEDLEWQARSA